MAATGQGRILWHGTTKQRAEAIMRQGPDPSFREPGGFDKAGGFSTAPPAGPHDCGDPREVAARKAALFPNEGGPAILEFEVPEEIIALSNNVVAEIRFEPHFGLEELCAAWPALSKRIL
jgi:hypothetical protein